MDEFDPFAVDRELRKCAERWQRFRRTVDSGQIPESDPFQASRRVCGRTTFLQLKALTNDPVAPAAMRWVYRLTEQRVNADLLLRIASARQQHQVAVSEPVRGSISFSQMLARALAEPAARRLWLRQALSHAEAIHGPVALLWERRQELATRLSLASPDELQAPAPHLYELAEQWLGRSAELWEVPAEIDLAELIERGLASKATLEWPSRIAARSLAMFFSESRLLEALELDLGRLPEAVAPASFLRALARLGSAFVDASAPRDQPFSIAHDAYGLGRRRHGALFALLLLNQRFLERHLGASRESGFQARRALAQSLLIESRLAALRVSLRRAALGGPSALRDSFEVSSALACRVPLPARAAGVVFRLHEDDLQRFAGLFLGALSAKQLTEAHDEDWFRNPRGVDQLRSEAGLPPATEVDSDLLKQGAHEFERILSTAL